ncbi:hypothetical protein V0288_16730 [Pannus brasiliensis CCIBt3594]|uniref:Type II toxin-antitoxin system Phd/YefM family antitoxin n=1 Tax=Pannus brasiliensis CCIBt3594 TaxID=1427578 RepID=A0AAW9QZL6_9CHRO
MINLHPEFIPEDGQPRFAVIPYEEFLQLQELLEDVEDLLDLRTAKQEESNQPSLSMSEVRKLLNVDNP